MLEWDCAADTGIFNVLAIACLGCESISDPSRCWMEWTWMTCRSLPKLMGSEVVCKYYSGTLVMLNIFPLLRWILVQATLAYVLILIMSITTWLMGEWPPRPPLVLRSKAPLIQHCSATPGYPTVQGIVASHIRLHGDALLCRETEGSAVLNRWLLFEDLVIWRSDPHWS